MNKKYVLFSSESVTEGHPDKVCDRIADAVLDAALNGDPMSRVACEVCCTTGLVMVMGEFTTETYIDIPSLVRQTVREIGYTDSDYGFDGNTCAVVTSIDEQSPDIARGVDNALETRGSENGETGAGDQGMMFGYACRETEQLMPLPITLAHALTRRLTEVRKNGEIPYLRPDGKAQVTVAYEDGEPRFVKTVVVSAQHADGIAHQTIERDIIDKVIKKVIGDKWLHQDTEYLVNPSGNFVVGGPHGDSGLTGRKIIVDTYGGMCPHGGGSFSGKDATKVDRSACYYARYVCKNIVAAGLADKVQLQVAYAIGRARPVSINIDCFGTAKVAESAIESAVDEVFDFRPDSIIRALDLRKPVYSATSNYGHFGNPDFTWEKTDKIDALRAAVKNG